MARNEPPLTAAAYKLVNITMAAVGFMPKEKGISSAIPIAALNPGNTPINMPPTTPISNPMSVWRLNKFANISAATILFIPPTAVQFSKL
jgi:hypothetical protein